MSREESKEQSGKKIEWWQEGDVRRIRGKGKCYHPSSYVQYPDVYTSLIKLAPVSYKANYNLIIIKIKVYCLITLFTLISILFK